MKPQRAATSSLWRNLQLHLEFVEHARGGRIDVWRQCRLHAAIEQQHLARMLLRRPCACRGSLSRHFMCQGTRQQGAHGLSHRDQRPEQPRARQDGLERGAKQFLRQGTRHFLFDHLAPDIEQTAILHAGGTGRFAIAASQATVQMLSRALGRLLALQYLLDQINAPTRAIKLVTQQLVGGASRRAKSAMHAASQDRIGFFAFAGVLDEIGEVGLHVFNNPESSGRG